jgi:hypothetical protein
MSACEKKKLLPFLVPGIGLLVVSICSSGCEGGSAARQDSAFRNASTKTDKGYSGMPGNESSETSGVSTTSEVLPHADEAATPQEKAASKPGDSTKQNDASNAKKVEMGKNVWLEVQRDKRCVVVEAEVCLREGMLEHLMCRKRTKEHEAILAADVDARDIHKALLLAKATPGTTVKYKEDGTIIPPTGTKIKVTLLYKDKEKPITIAGREWVRDVRTKKSLQHDWVFAGSEFQVNPLEKDKPPLYAANAGDVICVSNFEGAMLDLPINSSKNNAELEFEAFTERIPPLGTPVTVILEPVLEKKKTEK